MEQNTEELISQEAVQPVAQPQAPEQTSAPQFTDREKQYYARIKSLEKELELKKSQVPSEEKTSNTAPADDRIDLVEQKVDLRMAGYDRDEISEIEAVAKAKGITLAQAAELPIIKKGIDAIRAEKKSTSATPSSTGKVRTFEGKPINDILKDPEATPEMKQAAFLAKFNRSGANSAQ